MTSHRILVTGAAGCVGRSLCRALVERGHAVRAVVRSESSAERLPPQVELGWCGEMRPDTAWPRELFADVDAVIHLAAKVHCRRTADESEFMAVNAAATETLMRAASGVRRFVYCSSAHAVGNFSDRPLDESSPCLPRTPYGASKAAAEEVVRRVGRETSIEPVIVRPVPIYGPELPGSLMQLLRWIARGWPLPIGAIRNRRSFVYVENAADALIAAAVHPAAAGETYFVSDGSDLSLSEFAGLFAAAAGVRPRMLPIPPGSLRWLMTAIGRREAAARLLGSLVVDCSKLCRQLDWRPRHSVEEALQQTADQLRDAAASRKRAA